MPESLESRFARENAEIAAARIDLSVLFKISQESGESAPPADEAVAAETPQQAHAAVEHFIGTPCTPLSVGRFRYKKSQLRSPLPDAAVELAEAPTEPMSTRRRTVDDATEPAGLVPPPKNIDISTVSTISIQPHTYHTAHLELAPPCLEMFSFFAGFGGSFF